MLWIPSYHNTNGVPVIDAPFNLWMRVATSPANLTTNDVANPLGSSATPNAPEGTGIEDPAATFINTGLVLDARTVAACMRLTYTGKVTDSAGQIAWIDNYQPDDLLNNRPSINDFFNRATKTARLGLDTYEQLFRPDEATGTDRFRRGSQTDPCFIKALPGFGPTGIDQTVQDLSPKIMGFAWRGCEPGVIDHLVIDFVKVLEWRTETTSGLTGTTPKALDVPSTSKILAIADQVSPGWASRISEGFTSAASRLKNLTWATVNSEGAQAVGRIGAQAAIGYAVGGNAPVYTEVS
jgi:hypothetical protein